MVEDMKKKMREDNVEMVKAKSVKIEEEKKEEEPVPEIKKSMSVQDDRKKRYLQMYDPEFK